MVFPSQKSKESAARYRVIKIVGESVVFFIYTIHTNNCLLSKNIALQSVNATHAEASEKWWIGVV